jgi:hypothetical protein
LAYPQGVGTEFRDCINRFRNTRAHRLADGLVLREYHDLCLRPFLKIESLKLKVERRFQVSKLKVLSLELWQKTKNNGTYCAQFPERRTR